MKMVRLPSGLVFNLDQVIAFMVKDDGVWMYDTSGAELCSIADDAAMLKEYLAKRPLLVPTARGKKST